MSDLAAKAAAAVEKDMRLLHLRIKKNLSNPRFQEAVSRKITWPEFIAKIPQDGVFAITERDGLFVVHDKDDDLKDFVAPIPPEKEEFWQAKEDILKVFPEIQPVYGQLALEEAKPGGCVGCRRNSIKRTILQNMVQLAADGRDTSSVRDLMRGAHKLMAKMHAKAAPVDTKEVRGALPKGPRPACIDCCRKHVAQAIVLLGESLMGYPDHRWLAVGHLAEAAEEIIAIDGHLASELRTERLACMSNKEYTPDLTKFFGDLNELEHIQNGH